MPTVSIIIPTYNHCQYVLQTLQSVFAQTFTDYEVIVVNDGSPDDTADLLRPYADAGKLCYLEQSNGGQASARNRGIAATRGEFVALLDDDDLWPEDKLAWQVAVLQERPEAAMVGAGTEVIDGAGKLIAPAHLADGELGFEDLFGGSPFLSPGQTLIRKSALLAVGGLDASVWGADDWDLYFRLAHVGTILVRSAVALRYRLHSGNASRQAGRMFSNALAVIRRHLQDVPADRRCAVARVAYRGLYYYLGRLEADEPRKSIRRRLVLVREAVGTCDVWLVRQLLKAFLPPRLGIALRTFTGKRATSPMAAKA